MLNKNVLAIASIVLLAGLTACSPAAEPEQPAPVETEAVTPVESDGAGVETGTLSVQESCELFNDVWVDYGNVSDDDPSGYLDIAMELEKVNPTVAEETYGMFAAMKLAAIESSGPEGLTEDTQNEVIQWVLDASAPCTEAGVTLQM